MYADNAHLTASRLITKQEMDRLMVDILPKKGFGSGGIKQPTSIATFTGIGYNGVATGNIPHFFPLSKGFPILSRAVKRVLLPFTIPIVFSKHFNILSTSFFAK